MVTRNLPGRLARLIQRAALIAPLFFCLYSGATSALAQTPAVPDESTLARLVWTTMLAVDNANRTGNYSVLHALCAPEFQQQTSVEDLAGRFARLRQNRVDVGRAILLEPTYHLEPHITDEGQLRLRGGFEFRPRAVRFDILFDLVAGGWRIVALSVAEMETSRR